MAVKGKKPRPQRSGRVERSSDRLSGKRNGEPTPAGNKRRRTDDESDVGRAPSVTPASSARPPPLPKNGNQRGSPSNRGHGKGARKVLTPPRSRCPSRTGGGSRSPRSPAAPDKPLVGGLNNRTADYISGGLSESSDDCEVYEIQRVPFDDNPFYRKYTCMEADEPTRGALDVGSVSPITPASLRRNGKEVGAHCQEGEPMIELSGQRNQGVNGEDSPICGFRSPVDRDISRFTASREMLSSFYKDISWIWKTGTAQSRFHLRERWKLRTGVRSFDHNLQTLT